jgi:hypothetical protein
MITCKICGKEMPKWNYNHLKKHGINFEMYNQMFPGEIKRINGYKTKVHNDDIECLECGKRYSSLYMHIKHKHNMTNEEYKAKYPGAKTTSDRKRKLSSGFANVWNDEEKRSNLLKKRKPITDEQRIKIGIRSREYSMRPEVRLARSKRMSGENNLNFVGDNKILRVLKNGYKVTIAEYKEMMDKQGGVCAICGRPPHFGNKKRKTLCVDHDHATEKIRGLLCDDCNIGLGKFYDNPDLMSKGILYLQQNALSRKLV